VEPRRGQGCGLNPKAATDPLVRVIAQSLHVGDGDQKEVKSQIDAITALDVVVADQAVIVPIKPGRDLAKPIRSDQMAFS
jgi:hypothetical protein